MGSDARKSKDKEVSHEHVRRRKNEQRDRYRTRPQNGSAGGEGQAWWRRELHTADPWANEIPMGVWLADTGQRHLVPKEMAPALDFLSKDGRHAATALRHRC